MPGQVDGEHSCAFARQHANCSTLTASGGGDPACLKAGGARTYLLYSTLCHMLSIVSLNMQAMKQSAISGRMLFAIVFG